MLFFSAPAGWAVGEDEYLQPEQAFQYTATADENTLTVEWRAAKGYYLYKKRMGLAAATSGVTVGEPVYPKGESHKDEFFGEQEVFRNDFTVTAPLKGARVGDTVAIKVKWQGCADAGLCFPPTVWDASVKVASASAAAVASAGKVLDEGSSEVSGDDEFIDVDKAFALTSEALSVNNIQLNWRIADGYYLYKERIKVEPAGATKAIGALVLPKGENHHDEYFGDQEVYRQSVDATFSLPPSDAKSVEVKVTYQGCADAGLCYPPETKMISISLEDAPPTAAIDAGADGGYVSEQDSYAEKIKHGNLALVLLTFFGAGLLLAFTPCVLPMVPILSGIIAGSGENVTTRRSFMLSVSYVLGMAFTYTAAGIAAGAIGQGFNLQATFNQPWIITVFSLLFVFLAASMLGFFTIEMPNFVQTRLSNASNEQQAGTYIGVGVMGALSALIVSACVAPPLIAALTVISQTGDVVRGGAALFVMSLGMGTPLLLVGASAGKLLPRAGAWMDTVKNLFGVLFLGVAAWMLSRIVPGWAVMLLWTAVAASLAWVLLRAKFKSAGARTTSRALGGAAVVYGVALLVGIFLGSTNPLAPIPQLAAKVQKLEFKRFKTVADLEREVAAASAAGKPVMVDFYADWCVSCLEMEHKTFTQPAVQAALQNAVLLQADVTANDDEDKALYKLFDIVGPPTIAFYGPDGQERKRYRVVGFMKADEFASVVRQATAPAP
ncbi:MAG TPA: protein-disulfide reductase DsbD [Steroidobacteraceae bacterium]|nr:protein-disulfide reductase DsbD [Steroidobacteraceae bacterium]